MQDLEKNISQSKNVTKDLKDNKCKITKKHSSSKILISTILLLLILVIGILSWFLFFSSKQNNLLSSGAAIVSNFNKTYQYPENVVPSNESTLKQANLSDNSKSFNGKFSLAQGFAEIVDYAMPAVVNVSAVKTVETMPLNIPDSFANPFLKEFFKQFNMPTKKEKAISLGSGFIVRSDGFVVTNFHVIKGAKNIKVTLHDGKVFEAKLHASDPITDLAVLKISASNLPTLEFGDSSHSKVGDWVIAIGNPFGLGGTVSSGIVSARGRDINIGMYDEFIQTDAAINRGNSGGPMIDTKGRIIGVNTAIFSTTGGGSIGIGFAVPSNLVKSVVAQLITNKKVVRGWIGVQVQDIDVAMSKVLKLPSTQGAIVAGVTLGGPADKAGLKTGDIIIAVNNVKVDNKKLLPKLVSTLKPGDKITFKIISNGVEKTISVTIDKFPAELEQEITNSYNEEEMSKLNSFSIEEETFDDLGLKATNINEEVRRVFGLSKDINGVIITAVEVGSLAEEKGLISGLIISAVNNKKVNNLQNLKDILTDKSQDTFIFLILEPSRNVQFFISLVRGKPEESDE